MKKSKLTKFQKWWENKGYLLHKEAGGDIVETSKESWNAAIQHALNSIKSANRAAEGYCWQHEDTDILVDDLKEMIEK